MSRGKLIIAQVDHSSGEVIGHSIQKLYKIGAKNVQLLQSMTKKNRPGFMLFIDLPEEYVDDVAIYLGSELGIWGYHILESQHVHFDVSFHEKKLSLTDGENKESYVIKAKYIKNNGQLLKIKIDHDQLVQIQEKLEKWDCSYSLESLRAAIEARLRAGEAVNNLIVTVKRNSNDWGMLEVT